MARGQAERIADDMRTMVEKFKGSGAAVVRGATTLRSRRWITDSMHNRAYSQAQKGRKSILPVAVTCIEELDACFSQPSLLNFYPGDDLLPSFGVRQHEDQVRWLRVSDRQWL